MSTRPYKLPPLELKKFTGELKEWLPFWAQFSKVHKDKSIKPCEKFQYLILSTAPCSRARELVESFPATAENYVKAVNCLKTRYGREDLLTEYYVRELINIMLLYQIHKKPLSSIYDNLECHLRALETLGVTSDKCAATVLLLVESCLPEDILRMWQRYSSSPFKFDDNLEDSRNSENRLEQLMYFLRTEVEGEQKGFC
ncbi:hypothetical protein O3M35_000763 [Rhynocoris fuscipes]|uniref:Uncharacterized protein n=1 Tax=Rhynocoris fuscipes TaxID=488301 RepID=A0AAW1DSK4_9HEMI